MYAAVAVCVIKCFVRSRQHACLGREKIKGKYLKRQKKTSKPPDLILFAAAATHIYLHTHTCGNENNTIIVFMWESNGHEHMRHHFFFCAYVDVDGLVLVPSIIVVLIITIFLLLAFILVLLLVLISHGASHLTGSIQAVITIDVIFINFILVFQTAIMRL